MSLNEKRTLYISGLSEDVNDDVLRRAFIPFGPISQIVISVDPKTGKYRGFAFVEYEDPEDAQQALENMHESELYDRVLKIDFAKPQAINKTKAIWDLETDDLNISNLQSYVNFEERMKRF